MLQRAVRASSTEAAGEAPGGAGGDLDKVARLDSTLSEFAAAAPTGSRRAAQASAESSAESVERLAAQGKDTTAPVATVVDGDSSANPLRHAPLVECTHSWCMPVPGSLHAGSLSGSQACPVHERTD